MNISRIFGSLLLASALLLSGCASSAQPTASESLSEMSTASIGRNLEVDNDLSHLTFRSQNDALAANGLYYATWTDGDASDYVNSDDETVDLYDAQLYLLLEESKTSEQAAQNQASWLDAARKNYQIESEEPKTIGDETYTIISYRVSSATNPYARGISAFGTHDTSAVCIELTCVDAYDGDLNQMLTEFLERCSWKSR